MFVGILKSFLALLTKMLDGYLIDLRSGGITSRAFFMQSAFSMFEHAMEDFECKAFITMAPLLR
jgi:hypothetical protein